MADSNVVNAAKESAQHEFPHSLQETCTCEPVSSPKVRSLIRCADGWPRTGDVERVKKWPSWKPIACFYARSLPQTPMISFGIDSTPLPRAVARKRTRYLFERHRLLAAAVSACRCRWNGAVFLSNRRPSRECRIGGPGRDLVQTWDSSFHRLRIRHRSNTVCPGGRRSRRRCVEIRAGPPRLLAAQEL
jgi:hypothetical protein